MHGAHLVGDGTDAANASRYVGRLQVRAAAQKGFEESRRLEDLQLYIRDPTVFDAHPHRSFAFDAREIVDLDGPVRHKDFSCRSLSARNATASELKFLKYRT